MHPLKTMTSPRSESTIGGVPVSERSMIFNRRRARATGPLAQSPLPSGPRSFMVAAILATASTSARPPTLISPAKPHILLILQYQGIFEASPSGGVDDAGAGARHPREAPRQDVVLGGEHEGPQVHERLDGTGVVGGPAQYVGGEVQGLLGHEGGGVLLCGSASALQGLPVRFGAYDNALPP